MGYALFLTESLVWSLLLVATVTACAGRLRRGWLRLMLALPVPLVLLLIHVCLTVVAGFLQFPLGIVFWFYPMLALTVMFFAGTAWIVFRGLHRAGAESAITFAAGWPVRQARDGLRSSVRFVSYDVLEPGLGRAAAVGRGPRRGGCVFCRRRRAGSGPR